MSEQQTVETTLEQTSSEEVSETMSVSEETTGAIEETESVEEQTSSETGTEESVETNADEGGEPEYYLPVYKGQVRPVDPSNREEITELLQLGLHQREMTPLMDDLRSLAHDCGANDIREFIDNSRKNFEAAQLQAAIQKYGEKDGRAFYESQKSQRQAAFKRRAEEVAAENAKSAGAINERLADEFVELQAIHPELTAIEDVPKAVLQIRLRHGIALQDAYNRYAVQNQRKSMAQQHTAALAAKAATGSLKDSAENKTDPVIAAFISGSDR